MTDTSFQDTSNTFKRITTTTITADVELGAPSTTNATNAMSNNMTMTMNNENDNGNCLPSVVELKHSDDHYNSLRKSASSCSKKKIRLTIAAITISIFLILMVITLTVSRKSSTLEGGNSNDAPSMNQDKPAFTERYMRTMNYLLDQKISNEESLRTVGSPQYLATDYIANTLQLQTPTEQVADNTSQNRVKSSYLTTTAWTDDQVYRYVARYVLALNYYTFAPNINNNPTTTTSWMNFVTSDTMDICQWNYNNNDHIHNRTIYMGVTCALSTKLPVNLTINGNYMVGTLPTENGLLTSLQVLDLERNVLSGAIPTEICQLTNLKYFNLGHNEFQFSIPSCIGQSLTKLESLYLHSNQLEDPIPDSLSNLQNLKKLIISDNMLSGDPMNIWNQLSSLEVLFADRNHFVSSLDATCLQNNSNLEWLDVSDNNLEIPHQQQSLPLHLFQMPKLEVLSLSRNRLIGTLPDGVKTNTMLKYVSLYDNAMSGRIDALANLRMLRHLDISKNEFTGFIVSEIGQLTDLRLLFIGDNNFNAGQPIPDTFSNLEHLEDLSIRSSQLNGTVAAINNLPKSLIYLDLGSNHLSGSISDEISTFNVLEFLILNDNNDITGALPSSIRQMTSLRAIFVDGTSVSSGMNQVCELPNFLDSSSGNNVVAYADCGAGDDGNIEVDCDCCLCCSDATSINGCSLNYQTSLRIHWSNDFQHLKFTVSNDTIFINRDYIPEI